MNLSLAHLFLNIQPVTGKDTVLYARYNVTSYNAQDYLNRLFEIEP